MAAFNFPASPSNGDTYTLNSVTYQYDGTKWVRYSASVGAQGGTGSTGAQGATGSTGAQGAAGSATISNNADNRVITGGSGTNLNGEANLTFNGSKLDVLGNTDGNVQASFTRANDPNFRIQFRNESSSNNVGSSQGKFGLFYDSNSADICGMQFHRGSSTGAGTLSFTTGGTEKLSIDSDGLLTHTGDADFNVAGGELDIYSTGSGDQLSLRLLNSDTTVGNKIGIYFGPCNNVAGAYIKGVAESDFTSAANRDAGLEFGTRLNATFQAPLKISAAGYVTKPNQPAFSARGGPADVTDSVIVFATQVFQRGGTNYNTSTGIFTAPVDGIYHFMCNPYRYQTSNDSAILLDRSTNGGSSWTAILEVRDQNNYGSDSGRGWFTLALSNLIDLNKDDQVRIRAVNRVHTNGVFTRFSGFLVA